MNRDKRKIGISCLLSLCVVGSVAITVIALRHREPTYEGKTASQWADQYGSNHWSNRQVASEEAERAIRNIGTNAIPFYLGLLRTENSRIKSALRSTLPAKWRNNRFLRDNAHEIRRTGAHGFAALGTNGGAAVVPLIELAKKHPDSEGRYFTVFSLRTLGIAAEPALPFFIECLTNSDETIRDEGVLALATMHVHPEICVPALTQYLELQRTSPFSFEQRDAIQALGYFGTNSQPAKSLVASFLTNEDGYIREAVSNYLPQIDRDFAKRLHVKPPWESEEH